MNALGFIRHSAWIVGTVLLLAGCASTGASRKLVDQSRLDIIIQKVDGKMVCSGVVSGATEGGVNQGDVQVELFDQKGRRIALTPQQPQNQPVPMADHTAHAFYQFDLQPGQHPTFGVVQWAGQRRRVQPLGWLDRGSVIRGELAAGGNTE